MYLVNIVLLCTFDTVCYCRFSNSPHRSDFRIPRNLFYAKFEFSSATMNVFEVLRRLDAYPKTLEEFSQKTICGAAVTVISSIIMIWLLVFEFYAYLTPTISEELFVDTTRSHKLKINLELYIPKISCNCKSTANNHLTIEIN